MLQIVIPIFRLPSCLPAIAAVEVYCGIRLSGFLPALVSLWTVGLAQTALFELTMLSVGGVAGNRTGFPLP